jgi:hypothetical protein
MWLQHQSKRQLRLEKADSKRNVTFIVSWQNPIDWLRGCAMLEQSPGKRSTIRPQDRTREAIMTVVLIRKRKAL